MPLCVMVNGSQKLLSTVRRVTWLASAAITLSTGRRVTTVSRSGNHVRKKASENHFRTKDRAAKHYVVTSWIVR